VGWFVGVSDLDGCAVVGVDFGVAAEYDDEVSFGDEVLGELFRGWSLMSTPTSRSVWADRALTVLPGWVPAESTVTVSPTVLRMSLAAIWDLPAFFTQTNRTDGVPELVIAVRFRLG
jgi:hypothetical protein